LDLSHCTSLTALPEQLTVKGDLLLSFCTNLKTLPADLSVGENIDLTGCTSLSHAIENDPPRTA
jgi:hypothetical protein